MHGSIRLILFAAGWLGLALGTSAGIITKANNTLDLDQPGSWANNVVPGSTDLAQWDSTVTNQSTVSLGSGATWQGLKIFNPGGTVSINPGGTLVLSNSGVDLSGAIRDLELNCDLTLAANQSWPVAAGRNLRLGGGIGGSALLSLTGPGSVVLGGTAYSLGTSGAGNNALHLNGGTLELSGGTLSLGSNNNNNDGSHIQGGATFRQTGGTVNSSFYTRLGASGAGTLIVSGGRFNNSGEILFAFAGSGPGTVVVSNTGTLSGHFLRLGNNGSGIVHLDGGSLLANRLFSNNGQGTFYFNGGTLQPNSNPSSLWFESSVSSVYVENGGALINTEGMNVTLAASLQAFAGSTGGLGKSGLGTLTLTGTNSYAGPTVISGGTLIINGRHTGTGLVTVQPGGTLGGTGVVAGAVSVLNGATLAPGSGLFTVGGLNLGPDATLRVNLGSANPNANGTLRVNGDLVLDGRLLIGDNGFMSTGAVYTVIHYTGALVNNGIELDPGSSWDVSIDTSQANQARIVAVRKFPFVEISGGDRTVSSLYTNLEAVIHGQTSRIVWYEVRSNSFSGIMTDFGAHVPSTIWPFTVRHLKEGTNWVTVFARDNNGVVYSNSVRLLLNLPPDTPVRPRPLPAEIWWGGLSANQQLLDPAKPWDYVKRHQDGLFFHSAGYGGLTSADKANLALLLRPFNTKYWVELGGGTSDPGPGFVQFQAISGWGAHLTSQQNLGLVMSQITHDYHMENMEDVCRVHPDWPAQDQVAWWTGDLSVASPGYPFTSGIWRDIFNIYYTNNPHLKVGHTSSSVYWYWGTYPQLAGAQNNLLYNPLKDTNGTPITVNGTNVSFSFNGRDVLLSFVRMASQIQRPWFSFQTDFPWDYFGTWGNQSSARLNREKIRVYERDLQAVGARHTLICNVSNAESRPGGNDAQDIYYKTNSLNSMFLHQQEGGRADVYLFESWYGLPHEAAPETRPGSYANLAMDAIKYLKGIRDANGTLEELTLSKLSTSGRTNFVELKNLGEITCLPAIVAFHGTNGLGAVTYLNSANQDVTSAILSPAGYAHTNRLAPGQSTQIRVISAGATLDRTVTLEAFWNPQDPTGIVRDRLKLSPPNRAPILNAISNRTIFAGETLMVTNVATDPDLPDQTLTFSLINAAAEVTIHSASGLLTWRPFIAKSPAVTSIRVVVSDNGTPSLSATQSFWVTVNRPVQPTLSLSTALGGHLQFAVNGSPGPDYVLYGSTNLAQWVPVATNPAAMPPFVLSDPLWTNYNRRFYRVRIGP